MKALLRSKRPRTISFTRHTNSKRLHLECLENKNLLAGDVTAAIVGGDLVLTGDAVDNSFFLRRDNSLPSPGPGDLVVVGFNGTTINGVTADISSGLSEVPLSVSGDVIADLSQGSDLLGDSFTVGTSTAAPFGQLELLGSIVVDGGTGDVSLSLNNVNVAGDVTYSDASGALQSSVLAEDSIIGGDFISQTRAASNEIGADDTTISGDMIFLVDNAASDSFVTNTAATIAGDFRFESNAVTTTTRHDGSSVGDDLIIITGDGEDFIDLNQTTALVGNTIGDDLRILTGGGNDEIILTNINIGDDLQYRGGDGDDEFFFEPVGVTNVVGDDLYATGGDGDDGIGIEDVTIGDKLRVSGGAGDDVAAVTNTIVGRSTLISLGTGSNEASVEESNAGLALTIVGRGTNDISLDGVDASHFVTIITSSGDDSVSLNAVNTHSALVATKAGNDEVEITESVFDYLFVLLGSGDDTLTLEGVTVERFALLSGGCGTGDELVDNGDNDINFAIDFAFETGTI